MHILTRSNLLALAILFNGIAAVANADSYTFTKIQVPGSPTVQGASGINDSGEIVGYYGADNYHLNGFLDNHGTFTTISVANSSVTYANGINNLGQIVGTAYIDHVNYAFIDQNGTASVINVFANSFTSASGINDHGEIVGTYQTIYGGVYGFTYQNGVATSLSFPGALETFAGGINNAGEIVGVYIDSSYDFRGFTYMNGVYSTFVSDIPGALPVAINNDGEIAGTVYTGKSGGLPFGFTDINGQFSAFNLGLIKGLNDEGQLVGLDDGAFEATPTPEPSCVMSVILSGLILGIFRLKSAIARRAKQARA